MGLLRVFRSRTRTSQIMILFILFVLLLRSIILIYDFKVKIYNFTDDLNYISVNLKLTNPPIKTIKLEKDRRSISFSQTQQDSNDFLNISNRIQITVINSTGSDDLNYPLHIDLPMVVESIMSNLSVDIKPINDPKFELLIPNANKCKNILEKTGQPPEILILIKSAPYNILRRDTIRLTWGNDNCWAGRRVIHLFLLGNLPITHQEILNGIKNESDVYNDIIQQDFVDHYYNNTYKIMFGIKWAVDYCSEVPLIVFVDDDFFIYPKNIIAYKEGLSEQLLKYLISGYVWRNAKPVREKKNHSLKKWIIGWNEYPHSDYPPYVAAGNFFLSMNMAKKINIAIRYTKYLRFDDVYLGIILRKLLHVPIHLNGVYAFMHVNESSIQEIQSMISSHNYGHPTSQMSLWNRLSCQQFCTKPVL